MKRRSLRKIITRVIVFLLLGAIVNVAVAWGWALWYPAFAPGLVQERWTIESLAEWNSHALHEWPEPEFVRRHNFGYDGDPSGSAMIAYDRDPFTPPFATPTRTMSISWEDYGWPCLSLRAMQWTDGLYKSSSEKTVKTTYFEVKRRFDPWRTTGRLPLLPIWPGFAINTMFYAVILWVLFAAPFALRRRIRMRRGLCPACAYPAGASDVCTECGMAVKG